ncbi:MAG TPA: ABC transporter permease [Candidatus Acidoferrum sp.]
MTWFKQLFSRRRLYNDLSGEIQEHLEEKIDELVASGMSRKEATAAARREFGNVNLVEEDSRAVWRWPSIESVFADIRYALRTLRKSPGFTATAIVTLALGIGANTAIFMLLDAIRLRSLPVHDPQELAEVRITDAGHQGMGLNQQYGELTRPLWQEIRDHQQSFSGVFAWSVNLRYVGRGSEMHHFHELRVSGDFFRVLGVRPFRGRLLMPEDEDACPMTRAVVSYSYWQSELGGRDLGEGTKLVVDNELVEIVGVTPPGFYGMVVGEKFDIAIPFCQPKEELRRDVFEASVMGRLKPGVTMQRASAEMDALSSGIFEATVPQGRDTRSTETYKHFRLATYPASTGVSSLREYDRSLLLLLGIAGLVLLIACTNLANLMLARASARQREMALRLALGASRARLLRQLFTESLLLATTGAVLGVALAQSLSRLLVWSFSTEGAEANLQMVTDWRVLLFAAGVAVFTCVVFGIAPALRATRAEPISAMKAGGRGTTGGRERFSLQRLLVVAQVSVSLVLLVGALLFVRSFRNLMTFDPGMRENGITEAFLGFWQSNLPKERWADCQRELLEEVRSVPGVLNAATTTNAPLLGSSWEHGVRIGSQEGNSKFTWVSPDYFETMGIPVIQGRGLAREDTASSQRVALVNETFVRRYLNGTNPIGQTLRTSPEPDYPATVYEIVGVIPDTKYNDLRGQTPPMAFAPASQFPGQGPWTEVMIHSNLAPAAIAAAAKRVIAEKHPDVVTQFADFQREIRDGLVEERLMATLSGFFGLLAVLLALVGLYGVISYIVAMRRNEIGIRMALGASRSDVVGIIVRQTLVLLALGVGVGVLLALAAVQSAGSLLFELQPDDPLTFAGASALLVTIALIASFLPAQRASRVDPMVALRYE